MNRSREKKQNPVTSTFLHFIVLVVVLSLLLYSIMIYQDASELHSLTHQKYTQLSNPVYTSIASDKKLLQNQLQDLPSTTTDTPIPLQRVPNPTKKSKYAYTTLISGFDERFKYRGFIYNALIMKKALHEQGSTADFIVMAAFPDNNTLPYEPDMDLLRSHGIIVHYLPRILASHQTLQFAEMALLKVTPWSFTQYDRVQFLDGDVMPTRNMDCYFDLGVNTFTIGAVSPLNSGWYLALPHAEDYQYMISKAAWRLGRLWDEEMGWEERLPPGLYTRGGVKEIRKWDFNGADMDQGLFTHRFVLTHGGGLLVDTDLRTIKAYDKGLLVQSPREVEFPGPLACCQSMIPTDMFVHFTGRQKPWMNELADIPAKKTNLRVWAAHLDALKLDITSKTIGSLGLGSPLGFWNAQLKVVKKKTGAA